MECSDFFHSHEVIGSSLLFVHDRTSASIWLIDFAKTVELPHDVMIDHNSAWTVGNHEDGYLIGINNIIDIFEELLQEASNPVKNHSPAVSESSVGEELSSTLTRMTVEAKEELSDSPQPLTQNRTPNTTPSIVKTNSTQQIVILDNSKLVDRLTRDS